MSGNETRTFVFLHLTETLCSRLGRAERARSRFLSEHTRLLEAARSCSRWCVYTLPQFFLNDLIVCDVSTGTDTVIPYIPYNDGEKRQRRTA